jgi:diacylglycerol O-acyltransferase / wax synthase
VTFDRFRQRVAETGVPMATPHWQDVPHFDIDQHLHHIALAATHDQAALIRLVNDLASMPLDHSLPPWQAYVVDEVDGGSAQITRCDHCMANSTAMMTVTQRLFDPAPGGQCRQRGSQGLVRARDRSDRRRGPGRHRAGRRAGILVGELLRAGDPPSPLKGEFALGKHVAWSEPVPVRDIKVIGKRCGAKVNDVLVAAMTGALRTYLKGRGIDVSHTTVRAMFRSICARPSASGSCATSSAWCCSTWPLPRPAPIIGWR